MEAMINVQEWDRVEHYADALEEFTKSEPLRMDDFFIARGRALAAIGRGKHNDAIIEELQRLRHEAKSKGIGFALPALEKCISLL